MVGEAEMHRPLTVELPDEALANSLGAQLQPFQVETVAVDGYWEVRVRMIERNPESRVGNALTAIDAWLVTADVDSIQVHLDGKSYTLSSPPPS